MRPCYSSRRAFFGSAASLRQDSYAGTGLTGSTGFYRVLRGSTGSTGSTVLRVLPGSARSARCGAIRTSLRTRRTLSCRTLQNLVEPCQNPVEPCRTGASPILIGWPVTAPRSSSSSAGARWRSRIRDKVLFPAGRVHEARSRALLPRGRRGRAARRGGRPNVLVRYPNGIDGEFFFQKRAPTSRPPWIDVVSLSFPSGRTRRRGRAARRRGARVDGEPRLPRAAPASGARRRPRSSRRTARRSRSRAGRRMAADSRGRAGRARHARRFRPGRVAEDVRVARHARLRAHRAALDLRRGPARGAGAGARGRTARAGAGDEQVVEGRAPRRVPRLQPEREGSDRRRGILGPADGRTRASRRRSRGTRSTTCDPADFTLATMPARFAQRRRSARRHRRARRARSRRCSSSRRGTRRKGSATRRGRRTTGSRRARRRGVAPSRRRACRRIR